MRKVLTIAGSDSSGGAGIQADIKTMTMNGVYAMSAITALTAQNTTTVKGIFEVSADFLGEQLDAVFEDIFPDAVKIGMVSSAELMEIIAEKLKVYNAKNIVVDTVMVSTSGTRLMVEDAIEVLKNRLIPMAGVITPNIPETEILTGMTISSEADMEDAARKLFDCYGCSALVKGGHRISDANDVLYCGDNNAITWYKGIKINNPNTHGTGCTLSSAIASNLAKGYGLEESVLKAKEYLSGAISAMLDIGKGHGPLAHNFAIAEDI